MTISFNSATNLTVAAPVGLQEGVETLLWESAEITNGSNLQHIKLNVVYHEILPVDDGSSALVATLVQEQSDGSFEEIGRQNVPINKLEQGPKREIIVTSSTDKEEGIDDVIAGFEGIPVKLKSFFDDEASGTLKVCIHVKDTDQVNTPFVSARFSVNGTRYDP